jgi:hypothetical protein
MRIPLYLAIAQWALLLGLGFLVIIAYRQLGRIFGPRALSEHGPPAGSTAVSFEYERVSDGSLQYVAPGGGQAMLLAFVNPTCQTCEKLVASFSAVHQAGDLDGLRVLLLISDPPSYLQISDSFRSTALEIGRVTTRGTLSAYRAAATPLLVAIDSAGVIRSSGAAREIDEVRAFIQACILPPPESSSLPVVPGFTEGGEEPESVPLVATPDRER